MAVNSKETQMQSKNLAARMGRWSATHRKTAIFGWLAFVIAAFVIGGAIGTKQVDPDNTIPGQSGKMQRILGDEFETPAGELVLLQSSKLTAEDPQFRAAIEDTVATLERQPNVVNVRSPLAEQNSGQIGAEGRAALVQFDIRGDPDEAVDKVDAIQSAVAAAQKRHQDLTIAQVGDASASKQIDEQFAKDLQRAGLLSLPVTLIILVIAFGALVAAGIPLLLALSAVIATMGLIAIPSQLMPVGEEIGAIVLLIGLAVGVDYVMFYLKREREERAAGRDAEAAVNAAAATSGRSVLISGLTVMIAMAGMFVTGDKVFSSFAMATIIVVAVAVLGSLTVLPALLSKLGDNVERLRVPLIHRLRSRSNESRLWGAILTPVLRRPLVSAVGATALLLVIASPMIGMKLVAPGAEALPRSLPVMKTYDKVQAAFPGEQLPAQVVVKGDVRSPEFREALGQLEWRALVTGEMYEPITVDVNKAGTVARIDIPIAGAGTDEKSNSAVEKLREEIIPATVGALPNTEAGVTGMTAQSMDFRSSMQSSLPFVFAFVLGFAFVLLLVSFRSVVIAAKAIVLNLLSVAAAYGALVAVFQNGWGKDLLGFDYTGGVIAFLPVFMFVILFGLSMDYHVFIISRIREAYDEGMSTEDAVSHGIRTTAGVVTSAAIVMVFVFGIFLTLPIVMLKQFGLGLAIAVLIDATIVRAVLLPATMKLLGDWNWYLPRWLEWLPRLDHGERAPEAVPAAANA
jgi:uncharacterized membrane protein YdfJ with MMPL/SSD domain